VRTPRAYHRWYGLKVWRLAREAQLSRQPLCECCLAEVPEVLTPATDVDHKIPHRGNWTLFIDPENHQSLCHSCHSQKTARGE
jgi:5-methylcytosine-specific restriction protein A